jgi:hypothetical protein
MASQTPPRTPSTTRNTAAAHHEAVIRVYDQSGNVIETHEHRERFQREA